MAGNANWSDPTLASLYTDVLAILKDRDVDATTMYVGGSATNIPTGAIRFNRGTNRFQEWSGAAWANITLGGFGTMASQDSNNVAITGGTITGVTAPASIINSGTLPLNRGGTNASLSLGTTGQVLAVVAGAVAFSSDGTALDISATKLGTGTVPLARLSGITTTQMASANVSQFTNNSNYVASGANISVFTNNSGYVVAGANISVFTNNSGYLTSGTVGSYAPSLTGSGASGTWAINVTGNAATATTASSANSVAAANIGAGTANISISGNAATATSAGSASSVPASGIGAGTAAIDISGNAATATTAANVKNIGALAGRSVNTNYTESSAGFVMAAISGRAADNAAGYWEGLIDGTIRGLCSVDVNVDITESKGAFTLVVPAGSTWRVNDNASNLDYISLVWVPFS